MPQPATNLVLIANDGSGHGGSSNPFNVVYPTAPVIIAQPQSRTNLIGGVASFNVAAIGVLPLSYQWACNGTNLINATNVILTLTNLQPSQDGNYTVLITNLYGATNSAGAALAVVDALDHFTWAQIPSPRFVNAPFSVAIQALDPINQLFTNFNGTVALVATNGTSVNPPFSANFAGGAWSGSVTIAQTVSNLVLQANDGAGHMGLANPIDVVATPPLATSQSGGLLLLSWPIAPVGFVLETSTNLLQPRWAPVTTTPLQIGNQYLDLISNTASNQYYRLRYTLP